MAWSSLANTGKKWRIRFIPLLVKHLLSAYSNICWVPEGMLDTKDTEIITRAPFGQTVQIWHSECSNGGPRGLQEEATFHLAVSPTRQLTY